MWAPFSWTLSKPCVLSRIFGMFWIASLSWMILPPPQGLKIVTVPEFAHFFADRVCRVASVSRCRLHWTFLCVPLCRRLSPNTLSKFSLCSGSTLSTSHAHIFGQVETTEPESTIRAIISLNCRENGTAHVQVSDCISPLREGKDESPVTSRMFTNPDNALSIHAKLFLAPLSLTRTFIFTCSLICRQVSFALAPSCFLHFPFHWSDPF